MDNMAKHLNSVSESKAPLEKYSLDVRVRISNDIPSLEPQIHPEKILFNCEFHGIITS